MGVNVNRVISATFVHRLGAGALAGVMVGTYYSKSPTTQMGFMLGLKAFTAAVLGGIGNIGGAMAGRHPARRHRKRWAPATSAT
jgi:branched-chain amino acid transport system permease protein